MIGDDVKGMQIRLYPPLVRAGIQLHRYIDSFTDQHPMISEAKKIYRPAARLYAGPLADITMDYFLANDPSIYNASGWREFANWAYQSLMAGSSWHVGGFRRYFPYLQREDWFVRYRELPFIENSMANLLKRVGLSDKTQQVLTAFETHQSDLSGTYRAFFPQLERYAAQKANALMTIPLGE